MSPIGQDPARFGIELLPAPEATFARNDLAFRDPTDCDHDLLGPGLKKALYNYMLGIGFEVPVERWFADAPQAKRQVRAKIPKPKVEPDLVVHALREVAGTRSGPLAGPS